MAMQTRPVMFVVATVLLVPFVYALSYAPEVCAVPKDPISVKREIVTLSQVVVLMI